jgi:hypothetical protein
MNLPDDKQDTPLDADAEQEATEWEALCFFESSKPTHLEDTPPPQLVRTVNLLPVPEHDLRGPEDLDGIAELIVRRTRQGIGDLFAHADYAGYESEPTEAWARAIAEHQTGIPDMAPARFYGGQKAVAQRIAGQGDYPLVGQARHAVTTALCFGGWDGGSGGDIASGEDAQTYCASLGKGWTDVPLDLDKWPDELWSDVKVGACLFWSAESSGAGHVVMVMRKHPEERKWQLWDTSTSCYDPSFHAAVAQKSRMLWESHWWDAIPPTLARDWVFRGIGLIDGLGHLKPELKPRGRARLLLSRRSDKKLLFRSAWMDMQAEGLPLTWLLRGLRGAPFCDRIEATWCVNSPPGLVSSFPEGLPLLDCTVAPTGIAHMTWSWQQKQGYHERENAATWKPEAPYREAGNG